ncbi:MAG: hypothetical protein SGCHY_001340 [Lobulomycetales sp.]
MSTVDNPVPWHKPVGISLALVSALFIGSSFVIKKRGLLDSRTSSPVSTPGGSVANSVDSHAYLRSPLWWSGMLLMLLGELFNFAAYAFAPALLVTPLGALSVVVSAFFSSLFLNERLNFAGKVGMAQCIIGAVIIVLHTPETPSTSTVPGFLALVLAPGFLTFASIVVALTLFLIFYLSPRYGTRFPIVYISICSLIGSLVVVGTQGLGAALVHTATHPQDNQLILYQTWLVVILVAIGGVTQINYLNKALNQFSTAIVTPVYYVMFTTATLIAAGILAGTSFSVAGSAVDFTTLCFGFLTIVGGVALLFEYSLKLSRVAALARNGPGAVEGTGSTGMVMVEDDTSGRGEKLHMPLMDRSSFSPETAIMLRETGVVYPDTPKEV